LPRQAACEPGQAALLAGAVGAALGTFSIWAAGFVSTPDVWHTAVVWWLGDAAGIAIFAPLILAWWRGDDRLERVDLARSVPLIVAATLGPALN
jgi:integral membrane sensor domain MASE1